MYFHSFDFLIFVPFLLLCYSALKQNQLRNLVLLVGSYVFYCYEQYYLLVYILFSSALDYLVAPHIYDARDDRRRKALLAVSLVGNLGLLFTLKYFAWAFDAFKLLFNATVMPAQQITWTPPEFSLPPGISFYTFQSLSYTIDIYRGSLKPTRRGVDFFTYVAFFPQLIAGPIERARDLLPQLSVKRPRVPPALAEWSFFLIAWGLFKKLVCADNLGNIVDIIYADPAAITGGIIILPLAFCFQIYCDFSAYTDIARGAAGLFNIRLSRNFLTPYFAVSPSDFWRRWHITLSTWLRDYLYIPLGGNQGSRARQLRNLVITMFLGGLWHGAGLFFILWGLYHGLLLVLYRLLPIDAVLIRKFGRAGKVVAILIMFFFTCIGWLLFRTDVATIGPLATTFGPLLELPFDPQFWQFMYVIAAFSVPIVLTDYLGYRRNCEFVELYPRASTALKTSMYVLLFFAVSTLAKREGYGFIYFQF